jgi:hypothetical protein
MVVEADTIVASAVATGRSGDIGREHRAARGCHGRVPVVRYPAVAGVLGLLSIQTALRLLSLPPLVVDWSTRPGGPKGTGMISGRSGTAYLRNHAPEDHCDPASTLRAFLESRRELD